MYKNIKIHDVKYREPYFVQCSICKKEVSSDFVENVYEECVKWKYDKETDSFICDECYKKIL